MKASSAEISSVKLFATPAKVLGSLAGLSYPLALLEPMTSNLARGLIWRRHFRVPWNTLYRWFAFWGAEVGLHLQPTVPWVAVLGPDGSGKSSVLGALKPRLTPNFEGTKIYHWRPGFLRPSKGVGGPVTDPHGKPPRGMSSSLLKLVFLFLDWKLGYWGRLVHLRARGHLILFDRNYYDLLIDPKRYRYGGPLWLAKLVSRFIPRPNLVVLLDAPPEVLQARKQEVSFEETTRQRAAYSKLLRSLPEGYIVDAARPLNDVVAEIERVILDYANKPTARRPRLRQRK